MKVTTMILVFIVTFVTSFLFWPEFRYEYESDCPMNDPLASCFAFRDVDYSDWRLHGGITWIQQVNRDDMTGEPRIEFLGDPEQYETEQTAMFLGSLGIASIATVASKIIFKRYYK